MFSLRKKLKTKRIVVLEPTISCEENETEIIPLYHRDSDNREDP